MAPEQLTRRERNQMVERFACPLCGALVFVRWFDDDRRMEQCVGCERRMIALVVRATCEPLTR